MSSKIIIRVSALTALSFLAAGCASDQGQKMSKQTVTSVSQTRTALMNSDKEIQESLDALNMLEKQNTDLTSAFTVFKKEVQDVKKQAANVRTAATDMRTRATEYRSEWRADIGTLSNEELRQSARERAQTVEKRFERINELYSQVNINYGPYVSDLDDLQKFLSNDLTSRGVTAASPAFNKARTDGEKLRSSIRELSSELEQTSTALSPTTAPAAR
ncbi:MAG TPA: DUF2959 family protein [Tepidisphaeraceae bacterium]|jgi:uncharacterized protein YdiU (UPF0061 family)